MAKKKIGLKRTLKKNQDSLEDLNLPNRKPLPKTEKDLDGMKLAVEELHQTERVGETMKASPSKPQVEPLKTETKQETKEPQSEKSATKVSPKKETRAAPEIKLKRLTIDMEKPLHKRMKIWCDEQEVSMREYIIGLIEKDMKKKR